MILLISLFFTSISLSVIVVSLGHFLSQKLIFETEKPSPFECGFFSKNNSWSPFSMHFFLSALIFLIFDVELILLFPYLMSMEWKLSNLSVMAALMFLMFLSLGFFLEWSQKLLEWSK